MESSRRESARRSVLAKLGLTSLVTTAMIDIAASHNEHVLRQAVPGRFIIDGLTVDVPAGIYHPAPDSSSEFFIRNMKAIDTSAIHKTLEIGAGCGAISLFMAAKWKAEVTASDISSEAVEAIRRNADRSPQVALITSDLFKNIEGAISTSSCATRR